MAIKRSVSLRNHLLDQAEAHIGASPILRIYSGAAPAAAADAATGTLLAQMTLPADWMAAAATGSKGLLGTWEDAAADAAGTAGYYRILESTGVTTHEQGTVTATGGGGDIELNNTSIASGQAVTITGYTWTAGNA